MHRRGLIRASSPRLLRGFTLVEVILALGIATALLIVALLFYRQATDLRAQILRESERCTAVRLVVDRLTADLRDAVPDAGNGGFTGGSDSLSFLRHAAIEVGMTNTGLVRVSFSTRKSVEGTNTMVVGLDRHEVPLAVRPVRPGPASFGLLSGTNRVEEPLTEDVRYLQFRYWDGAAWLTGWTNGVPPAGVEIILGPDPLPEDANPAEPAPGLVRRVVCLPTGIALRQPSSDGFNDPVAP